MSRFTQLVCAFTFRRLCMMSVLCAIGLAAMGCQSTGAQGGLSQQDQAAQHRVSSVWEQAVNAKDWNAVAATYAPDGLLMPPNGPIIEGRENIRQFFANFPPVSDMKLQLVEIEGQGRSAFVRGVYSMAIAMPDGGTVRDTGKYLELRTRQADGSWLILWDMFNSDLAAGGH